MDPEAPDQVCADDSVPFSAPTFFNELIDKVSGSLSSLNDIATTDGQKAHAAELVPTMTTSLWAAEWFFWRDLWAGKCRRWFTLKPHFEYASKGLVAEGAVWMKSQV